MKIGAMTKTGAQLLGVLAFAMGMAGCAVDQPVARDVAPMKARADRLPGYLSQQDLPSSLSLLPPPPALGSVALALDQDISRRSFQLRGTARWTLAASDADLSFPHAAGTYSCALNMPISEQETPRLYTLLRRMMADDGLATAEAKGHYNRQRPYVVNKGPTCAPQDEDRERHEGSYPSGHTAIGWGWALVLTELAPQHADAILARGVSFGASRNVCNYHWYSDVVQGRMVATATVARLHADPGFAADMLAAKAEIADLERRGLPPDRDCAAEAAALAVEPSLAP